MPERARWGDQSRDDVSDVAARPLPQQPAATASTPAGEPPITPMRRTSSGGDPPPAGAVRPTARFMRGHPAHWIALGFGAGLSPVAPGTVGTLWAWLSWLVLTHWLTTPIEQGWLLGITLAAACWASSVTAHHLRSADPGAIVIDEIVAFWLVLWLVLPAGFWAQLAAFVLFRFFDAVKPGPVGWADRLLHGARGWRGGVGIVLDDLVAAGCTLLVMALWRAW